MISLLFSLVLRSTKWAFVKFRSATSCAMDSSSVAGWLKQAGLQQYTELGKLDAASFKSLLMQDYHRYGVSKLEDKQKLFRVIKTVNGEASAASLADSKVLLSSVLTYCHMHSVY